MGIARLDITAHSIGLLNSDMRVLGESDGLPRLPDTQIYLWIRPSQQQSLVRQAFALLVRASMTEPIVNNRCDNV